MAETVARLGKPRNIMFTASFDGTTQRYVAMLPSPYDAMQKPDALMVFHGHGTTRWLYVRNDRAECRAARDIAAKHGMILVSPDYRAPTSWMGPAAEADVLDIVTDIRARFSVNRIFFVGASMGGAAVLTFTALHPNIPAGVVSQNGLANHVDYENFQDAIAESFGGTKADVPAEYRRRSAEFYPARFTMPIAFTAGGRDSSVPPDSVRRLADVLAKQQANVMMIYRPEGGHDTNYEDTVDAIEYVLQHAKLLDIPRTQPLNNGQQTTNQ